MFVTSSHICGSGLRIQSCLSFLKGIPAILLGVVALFFLPDRPETTMLLSPRERECAVARMRREMTGGAGMFVNRGMLSIVLSLESAHIDMYFQRTSGAH